jgi:protein gp37
MDPMNARPWNIIDGCERLSPGCDNCPTFWEAQQANIDYHPVVRRDQVGVPLGITLPTSLLVAAGSDLFHEAIRVEFIQEVFEVMKQADWHQFEVMTKRVERMESLSTRGLIEWPKNVIAGAAVEESRYKWRVEALQNIKARRMVMFGPITGAIGKVNLDGIESAGVVVENWGPYPRSADPMWLDEIVDQITEQNVNLLKAYWLCEEAS